MEYSAKANLAKVSAGLKGGPFNKIPSVRTSYTFVEGWPASYGEIQDQKKISNPTPQDVWSKRHGK